MAKLEQSNGGGGSGLQILELAPPGQYIGVCLAINDLFGVTRKKFENPMEEEIKDVTRFVFGIYDRNNKLYVVQTYEFTISANSGSNLMRFLSGWIGRAPEIGWDYCEMIGKGAMLTIEHKQSKGQTAKLYANISNIAAIFPGLEAQVPPPHIFTPILQQIEAAAKANRQAQVPAGAPARGPAPAPFQQGGHQAPPAQHPQAQGFYQPPVPQGYVPQPPAGHSPAPVMQPGPIMAPFPGAPTATPAFAPQPTPAGPPAMAPFPDMQPAAPAPQGAPAWGPPPNQGQWAPQQQPDEEIPF